MATYVIGDVHGCFRTLKALLRQLDIDYKNDRIWLVGDLVNRGPGTLESLRWAIEHSDRITMVLGNHELHLLAVESGAAKLRKKDTLTGILEASDRDDLVSWVRSRPLLHREQSTILVHAGLRAEWTVAEAEVRARACESLLSSAEAVQALRILRGKPPHDDQPIAQEVLDLDFMTRVRVVDDRGDPFYSYTGPPNKAPEGCLPWFSSKDRRHADHYKVFGHWAALGLQFEEEFCALDAGCVWGAELVAIRLDDLEIFRQKSLEGSEQKSDKYR